MNIEGVTSILSDGRPGVRLIGIEYELPFPEGDASAANVQIINAQLSADGYDFVSVVQQGVGYTIRLLS